MRVLVVHNEYSSRVPSGENLCVRDEVAGLRAAGVEVVVHTVSNDAGMGVRGPAKIGQAVGMAWSAAARRRFVDELERVQPDVVHTHNLFPLLTSSVPWSAIRARLPVVWTCHNRRVVCVEGTHYRDGAPCTDCRPGWRVPGVLHGCYQRLAVARGLATPAESVVASGLVTLSTSVFRAVARRHVIAIAPADNVRRWLVDSAGFRADRVRVKYNGVPQPHPSRSIPPPSDCDVFLFAGQLADYKGLPLLLDAWSRASAPRARLRIIGEGMCAPDVESAAAADDRISFVGPLPPEDMTGEYARARVVVTPSTTPETFGRVAAEALAHGRPVITSGLGGLGEIVDDGSGWVTGVDPSALAAAIDEAATSDAVVAAKGEAGRARYAELFSPEATTAALLAVYRDAIALTRQRGAVAG